jgi:ATP-dependent RNA helicase DDX23/PRP28
LADEAVFYDLKNMLSNSKISTCPIELLNHEASQNKPGELVEKKRKRDETLYTN